MISKRCELFENIASDVWGKVMRAHDVNIDLKEIGITTDIIVDILHFSKRFGASTFDVYARPGWQEKNYGNDLDVFVETLNGKYIWFALQAKLLKKNNRYDGLRDSSNGVMQWEKLLLLEAITGCKGYYLLYNGKRDFEIDENDGLEDQCGKLFAGDQYGCSLVEPSIVKHFAQKKEGGRFVNPTFENIHPKFAQPWRILTCCKHFPNGLTLYNIDKIINSDPLYRRINTFDEFEGLDDNDQFNPDFFGTPFVPDNTINSAMRGLNWNPISRLIIHKKKIPYRN